MTCDTRNLHILITFTSTLNFIASKLCIYNFFSPLAKLSIKKIEHFMSFTLINKIHSQRIFYCHLNKLLDMICCFVQ